MKASFLIALILVLLLMFCGARAEDESVRLKPSAVHELGAADPALTTRATAALLKDGPVRLEEIQRAEHTLRTILDMHAILQTPHRDVRIGKAVSEDEVKEAVAFFVRAEAIRWLLDDLNDDRITRFEVSRALLELPADLKQRNHRFLIQKLIPITKSPLDEVGSLNTVRTYTAANFARLLGELIDQPVTQPSADDLSINWYSEGPRLAKLAEQWLKERKEVSAPTTR